MLTNVNTLVTGLDAHRSDITDALDGLNRLSAHAERPEGTSSPQSSTTSAPACRCWPSNAASS